MRGDAGKNAGAFLFFAKEPLQTTTYSDIIVEATVHVVFLLNREKNRENCNVSRRNKQKRHDRP